MSSSTQLERYRQIAPIGKGGMATVALAEDMVLGRQVALKRVHVAGDARALSRLRREALVGASVSHPNLVSVFDVINTEDGDSVIVMEYVPGETLRDTLFERTRLAPDEVVHIIDCVASALDAIHREGIVHRDVKPANILLGSDGTVKLADLGIASSANRTRITTDGAVLGTFSYMAPEQLSGEDASPAVDVYALSAVAFEALAGRKARTEHNPVVLAHAISNEPPPDLRTFSPDAPPDAAGLLSRGMSRDPGDRPRTASELAGRLRAALVPETTAAVPRHAAPSPKPLRTVPARAAAAPDARVAAAPPVSSRPAPAPPRSRPAAAPPRSRPAAAPPRSRPAAGRSRPAPPPRRSRHSGVVAAALLGLLALAIVLMVLLSDNGSGTNSTGSRTAQKRPTTGSRSHRATGSTAGSTPGSTTASSSAGPSTAAPASPNASTPVSAVESFYGLAAAHRYASAWTLADQNFRNQLLGYQSFEAGQAGDRSITFNSARVVSQSAGTATVAVQTTSVRDNGTQHCFGTVDLVHGSSGATWLLHQISINCS